MTGAKIDTTVRMKKTHTIGRPAKKARREAPFFIWIEEYRLLSASLPRMIARTTGAVGNYSFLMK